MASVNKVFILGNVGRDPEIRYSPDGKAMASISVATTSSWKDKTTGDKREETEWHRVTFFGRLAEIVEQYVAKGSPIHIEGRLRTRKWQDKESGQDRYATEIVAESMQLLGGRRDSQDDDERQARTPPKSSAERKPAPAAAAQDDDPFDDIPF